MKEKDTKPAKFSVITLIWDRVVSFLTILKNKTLKVYNAYEICEQMNSISDGVSVSWKRMINKNPS